MTTTEASIFVVMVFLAIVSLATAMIVPTAGTAAQANRKMRSRIRTHLQLQDPGITSLIRDQHLKNLSPIERTVETIPLFQPLSRLIEQSGESTSAFKVLMKSLLIGVLIAISVFLFLKSNIVAIAVGVGAAFIPVILLMRKRAKRFDRFEEQLSEALNVMARALEAGHPLVETFNLISEEMQEPIASEFGRVFSDLNYGLPLKAALQSLLLRMPSTSLHSLVTAMLVQSETGGALAEILKNVAAVIRSRFKLQRKIKTLSAEGRLSAWILAMVPFVLSAIISLVSPEYLPILFSDPIGRKIVLAAFAMMLLGVLWIRTLIRIRV